MIRKLSLFIFSWLISSVSARAYEFKQVETLFDLIQTEYKGIANLKEISLNSCAVLTQFDNTFRLYNSDSKAFLYENNNLIGVFNLPEEKQYSLWKQFTADILQTSVSRSAKISNNPKALENEVIKTITNSLDGISRIEKDTTTQHQFKYVNVDGILYIKSTVFYAGFSDYLKKVILSHPDIRGIILDLRNNRGGNFDEAIRTADLFLDRTLITFSETQNHPKRYYTSTDGDIVKDKPVAVLVNELTASAAEIVTAALLEQSRAVVIGTKTFGKDSIQKIHQIGQKTLFLTHGNFYTPSGIRFGESGITPQICTGINNSCQISDKENPDKDIFIALDLIKKTLG